MLVKMARPRGWPVGRPVLHPAGTFGGPNRSNDLYLRPSAHRRRLRCFLHSQARYDCLSGVLPSPLRAPAADQIAPGNLSNLSEVLVLIGRNGDLWNCRR